ncbi:MAG: hypothetical protein PHC81_06805 [Clostridia bacterium]|nr:hypothetical protein [Clostridia bacterium]
MESGDRTVVLDTKWKLLSDNARNSGISQADKRSRYWQDLTKICIIRSITVMFRCFPYEK